MTHPRIAIIGAGSLSGAQIYPRIAKAGAKLAAVCDLDENKAKARTALYGGKVYTDMDKMLAEEPLDGVMVCVGPGFHPVGAQKVMKAGLPVYTEKPAAESSAEVLDILRVQRETGQLYMCAFKKRYADGYRRAKEFIDSPAFGQPSMLSMFKSFRPYLNTSLRRDFLLDFCVHGIDLATYLFGNVDEVYAYSPEKNTYVATLKYVNGAAGTLSFCGHRPNRMEEVVEITGEDSYMTLWDSSAWRAYTHGEISEVKDANFATAGGNGGNTSGHQSEIDTFIQAIQGKAEIVSDAEACFHSMLLYEAIRDSAASDKVVKIDNSIPEIE